MNKNDTEFKKALASLAKYLIEKLGITQIPKTILVNNEENSKKLLGKTAHYDPENKSISLFITGRHPKDVMRSFSHEMVHHFQNERGDLKKVDNNDTKDPQYAQNDSHLRKMEREAYETGNMMFRDWEDQIKYGQKNNKTVH